MNGGPFIKRPLRAKLLVPSLQRDREARAAYLADTARHAAANLSQYLAMQNAYSGNAGYHGNQQQAANVYGGDLLGLFGVFS